MVVQICLSGMPAADCQSLMLLYGREIEAGEAELAGIIEQVQELQKQKAELESEAADKASDIAALQTEKEIQQGGEVKELQQQADNLAKK